MKTGHPTEFQSRYVAYAKAHGKSPEAMIELDRSRGGIGAWFSPWIEEMWSKFDQLTSRRYRIGGGHTDEGQERFDKWLNSGCTGSP